MSYEAGIKTVLLDHKLRFNLTAYYFKTKDLQLSAVGGATNANLLLNADAVKGHGFEAELEARPVARPDPDRRRQLQQDQDPRQQPDRRDLRRMRSMTLPIHRSARSSIRSSAGDPFGSRRSYHRRQFAAAGAEVDRQLHRRLRVSGRPGIGLRLHRLVPPLEDRLLPLQLGRVQRRPAARGRPAHRLQDRPL